MLPHFLLLHNHLQGNLCLAFILSNHPYYTNLDHLSHVPSSARPILSLYEGQLLADNTLLVQIVFILNTCMVLNLNIELESLFFHCFSSQIAIFLVVLLKSQVLSIVILFSEIFLNIFCMLNKNKNQQELLHQSII